MRCNAITLLCADFNLLIIDYKSKVNNPNVIISIPLIKQLDEWT